MRLAYIEIAGFRGYRTPVRVDLAPGFTIIDGRNGAGKSTLFDAVEFALTGDLSKYNGAKADGETVADYIWWTGAGDAAAHYVEVGFTNGEETFAVRRDRLGSKPALQLDAVLWKLCDRAMAPKNPLIQLCASSIIRDEHIASLSLDLKETERYALLRDALGANDSDAWIVRGQDILTAAKKRNAAAAVEVSTASGELAAASRRVDEVRTGIVGDEVLEAAIKRLRKFSGSAEPAESLAGPVRLALAAASDDAERISALIVRVAHAPRLRAELARASEIKVQTEEEVNRLEAALADGPDLDSDSASLLELRARAFATLALLGREIGLQDGHCPLCEAQHSPEEFAAKIAEVEERAKSLDGAAAQKAVQDAERRELEAQLNNARNRLIESTTVVERLAAFLTQINIDLGRDELATDATVEILTTAMNERRRAIEEAQRDFRTLETMRLAVELQRAKKSEADAKERLARCQERLSRARRAEATAQAMYDAARRAASEALDLRLDRVLPLMAELYQRLRPHPFWSDIEYSIRGDVKRFLKLQVGEELNPQFIFSSGQRRATGLAFLLAINLSLAWSLWRSVLLDDPVQHIDDFRTVQLAELSAQLVAEGRQVICAVEDAALADLLCRRLPIAGAGWANRVSIGPNADGDLSVLSTKGLAQHPEDAFFSQPAAAAS
jgi:chromosome segregation protein